MSKANTTVGEGILNQTIALAEKLRDERDNALIEARDMKLRLTRIVEGSLRYKTERDDFARRLKITEGVLVRLIEALTEDSDGETTSAPEPKKDGPLVRLSYLVYDPDWVLSQRFDVWSRLNRVYSILCKWQTGKMMSAADK